MAGLVPWLLTRWEVQRPVPGGAAAQVAGAMLVGAGASAIANSFVRFATEGVGTPAPFAPPKHLVVSGLYRHVRNPMYVSFAAAVTGQALLLGQPKLFGYGRGTGGRLRQVLRGTRAGAEIRGRV